MQANILNGGEKKEEVIDETKVEEPKQMFRLAIQQNQLGLAYLMIDEGYDLMLAI